MNLRRTHARVTFSASWTLIPTHWCRNTCGYCVFVERTGARAELVSLSAARAEIVRAHAAGATELLVMSGEGVEQSRGVREALRREGFASYVEYLVAVARTALARDLLPHVNIGNLCEDELHALRAVVPSLGMMLETTDASLRQAGGAHAHAPDKEPARRLETLRAAGRARVPFTTGLLVGIGESFSAREETLRAIADVAREYGHIQEVIVQPFTPHAGTALAQREPPRFEELRDVVALAREILPAGVTVQIPPNIATRFVELVQAGARDLGGVSPDGDRINPQERWLKPHAYAAQLAAHGYTLRPRLAVYDRWTSARWLSVETSTALSRVRARLPDIDGAQETTTRAVPDGASVKAYAGR